MLPLDKFVFFVVLGICAVLCLIFAFGPVNRERTLRSWITVILLFATALAAWWQVRDFEFFSKVAERPFVFMEVAPDSNRPDFNLGAAFVPSDAELVNDGKTPVFDAAIRTAFKIEPSPSYVQQILLRSLPACDEINGRPEHPKGTFKGHWNLPFISHMWGDEDKRIARKNGVFDIYFYGRVCYEDAFREPHMTTFCKLWQGQRDNGTLVRVDDCQNGGYQLDRERPP
jgi:hypothetical protein